jgi:hypothetical protein
MPPFGENDADEQTNGKREPVEVKSSQGKPPQHFNFPNGNYIFQYTTQNINLSSSFVQSLSDWRT